MIGPRPRAGSDLDLKVHGMRSPVSRFAPLLLALLLPLAPLSAKTERSRVDALSLEPNAQQTEAARWMAQLVSNSRFHYSPQKLDDALSGQIFDRYLESLDGDKLFFTAADVAEFRAPLPIACKRPSAWSVCTC